MYTQKTPEFHQEFVEFIRIAKKFFEKIFIIEIKIFNLIEKSIHAKNIYEGKGDARPYHEGLEISKILKFFMNFPKYLQIYENHSNYIEKIKLINFLYFVLNSRNSIAHNKSKIVDEKNLLTQLDYFNDVLIRSETIYSLHVHKRYYKFLEKFMISLKEKIEVSDSLLKLSLFI